MRSTAQESKANYARCSTGYESASRKLGDAWGIAKGCTSNLAGAEGLKLPSPFILTVRAATDCVKAYRHVSVIPAWVVLRRIPDQAARGQEQTLPFVT